MGREVIPCGDPLITLKAHVRNLKLELGWVEWSLLVLGSPLQTHL